MSATARSARATARPSRTRQLSGYAVVLLALAVIGTVYASFGAPSSSAQEQPNTSMQVTQGKELFRSGCSTCHGLNLAGGAGGPSLIGVGGAAVVFQVESGRMPLAAGLQQAERKKPKYSVQQVDALAAYIQSNGGGATIPSGNLTDGDLQLGGALFRTNCASCHNFAGSGGALTYGKYAPELKPASARVVYGAMLSGPESMPRYGDNQLQPAEKRAITRYVRYITQAQDVGGSGLGRYGPISEGLVIWIVGIGAMVGLTLWIGARS